MHANRAFLLRQSSREPALFHPHPALSPPASRLLAMATLRPGKNPVSRPPFQPEHVAFAFSLRHSRTQTLTRCKTQLPAIRFRARAARLSRASTGLVRRFLFRKGRCIFTPASGNATPFVQTETRTPFSLYPS